MPTTPGLGARTQLSLLCIYDEETAPFSGERREILARAEAPALPIEQEHAVARPAVAAVVPISNGEVGRTVEVEITDLEHALVVVERSSVHERASVRVANHADLVERQLLRE